MVQNKGQSQYRGTNQFLGTILRVVGGKRVNVVSRAVFHSEQELIASGIKYCGTCMWQNNFFIKRKSDGARKKGCSEKT